MERGVDMPGSGRWREVACQGPADVERHPTDATYGDLSLSIFLPISFSIFFLFLFFAFWMLILTLMITVLYFRMVEENGCVRCRCPSALHNISIHRFNTGRFKTEYCIGFWPKFK